MIDYGFEDITSWPTTRRKDAKVMDGGVMSRGRRDSTFVEVGAVSLADVKVIFLFVPAEDSSRGSFFKTSRHQHQSGGAGKEPFLAM